MWASRNQRLTLTGACCPQIILTLITGMNLRRRMAPRANPYSRKKYPLSGRARKAPPPAPFSLFSTPGSRLLSFDVEGGRVAALITHDDRQINVARPAQFRDQYDIGLIQAGEEAGRSGELDRQRPDSSVARPRFDRD